MGYLSKKDEKEPVYRIELLLGDLEKVQRSRDLRGSLQSPGLAWLQPEARVGGVAGERRVGPQVVTLLGRQPAISEGWSSAEQNAGWARPRVG